MVQKQTVLLFFMERVAGYATEKKEENKQFRA